ncbi:hypothetical protein LXL04_012333 [Taraxacum kok-saghyz]
MDSQSNSPHVLIFPFPVQGHVSCMLKLAELLCLSGLSVTFLNSDIIHRRLLRYTDVVSRFSRYPGFRFETISDGLPPDHPRSGNRVVDIFDSIKMVTKPMFREMLLPGGCLNSGKRPPVSSIIADGIMCFTIDVAKDLGIPIFLFRTVSASCFWAFYCIPKLIESGDLPIKEDDEMDRLLIGVTGMEEYLRLRDLPSFCRASDLSDRAFQVVTTETQETYRANGLILNTFEDLEESALAQIRNHIPNLYSIGPLHANLKSRLEAKLTSPPRSSNSLWEEDRTCMTWLDKQAQKSVIYVSFGSMTLLSRNELTELWYGLVNSRKNFLWVVRPNSVAGDGQNIPPELLEGTMERGYMVRWAPQEEVLAHPAVGGFLTHSGWNSTLESIVAAVPMVCWPYYADQQVNSRLVGEVWKLGFDMKDICDRIVVEKVIKDLMDTKRDELMRPVDRMMKMARRSVAKDGTSHGNLNRLIEDIKTSKKKAECPVNCMLKLAELLCLSGISVTVLNTDHIQRSLIRHTDVLSRFSRYSIFRFETISDGLPDDHPRSGDRFLDILEGFRTVTEPAFREMMVSGCFNSKSAFPVTLIIPDGSFSFALDVAEEIEIPLIYFETVSPCALWTYLCLPKLIQAGEVPFDGDDLDVPIKSVPGTETFLRRRDLPSFYRSDDLSNPALHIIMNEAQHVPRAHGLIINTFEALDASILVHMRSLCPNIYTIGPLHTLLKSRLTIAHQSNVSNSLWEENRDCISWLDTQPEKSVVYVSIGSMATMTVDQFFEIWHGLVNSGKPFLWVKRPGSIIGEYDDGEISKNLIDETKERGFMATWVPQEEVLAHLAIGGFITHSGWNSTMESIVEGVPMICWPHNVDQLVNSRFVSEVWKIGIDMKDTCDRVIIEKAVKDVVCMRKNEFSQSVKELGEYGVRSVEEGGTSYMNLDKLIEDIKSMGKDQ